MLYAIEVGVVINFSCHKKMIIWHTHAEAAVFLASDFTTVLQQPNKKTTENNLDN